MALPQGIDYCEDTGFVSHGTDIFPDDDGTAHYPTVTSEGNNVGWETVDTIAVWDIRNDIDTRLAGYHEIYGGSPSTYRIDLPATGDIAIRCACGGSDYGQSGAYLEIFDTTTSRGVLVSDQTTTSNQFVDAQDAVYNRDNWPGSNTISDTITMTTTILRFEHGISNTSLVAHVWVEEVAGGGGSILQMLNAAYYLDRD